MPDTQARSAGSVAPGLPSERGSPTWMERSLKVGTEMFPDDGNERGPVSDKPARHARRVCLARTGGLVALEGRHGMAGDPAARHSGLEGV